MPATHEQALRELASSVRGELRPGLHDRMLYATDASIYQAEPLGVLIPDSVEDAVAGIAAADRLGLALLPRGGGTSLAGQAVSDRAIVLDLSPGCHRVTPPAPGARVCHAESGATIGDVNRSLEGSGLFFAPDPSTADHATIGGCIGNNAAGAHSVLYGRTSENIVSIDACLPDGARLRFGPGAAATDARVRAITDEVVGVVRWHERLIRERFPKTARRSSGYQLDEILAQLDAFGDDHARLNLAPLLCGSEGTLAVTLGAELRLHPVPGATGLIVLAFGSVDEAISAVPALLETEPAAVELLDDLILSLAAKNAQCRPYLWRLPSIDGATPAAMLYVEYFADSNAEVRAKLDGVRALGLSRHTSDYTDAIGQSEAWSLRKAGEPLLHAVEGDRKPLGFVEDNAVPVENLGEFVRRFRDIVTENGTIASFYAHASVGVLHVRPMLDLRDPEDERRMRVIAADVAQLTRELGGVVSGEHGDGRARGPFLEDQFGPELMGAFRQIKRIFDPQNRLNPGNIVEPGAVETISLNVRVRPKSSPVSVPEVETLYDYADQGGFGHAVEMCNGAGVCRKKASGVMCPSYMATLDERHATRGRGNALRLAITGQLGTEGTSGPAWNDPDTLETLDLCLGCKACKSECPSSVDIARLKAEYHAQRHKTTGAPWRSRVMGNIHTISRLGAMAPRITNITNRFPPTRAVLNAALGLHPRRSLPHFEPALPKQWGKDDPAQPADAPRVALLADTFTTYNEPGVALATRRVLESFGYRVELVECDDFQRARISLGLLREAIKGAAVTLDRLRLVIEDDSLEALLVIEPSCLSAIADDWQSLKIPDRDGLRARLAERAALPEVFLHDRWDDHPCRPEIDSSSPPPSVAYHGHCHQRALWGVEPGAALLRRFLGDRLEMLDTTCCGMAGSFGYTRDHFDLSMRIGELGLLPAARAMGEGRVMCAPGTSCRHQILDGAGVRARHPMEVVADVLER